MSAGIVAVVVVVAFGLILSKTPGVTQLDLSGDQALTQWHVGFFATMGEVVYKVFSPIEAIALIAVVSAVIWGFTRNLRLACTFAATVAITWIPSDIVKMIVHRPRPDVSALAHHLTPMPVDASYPSGHMVFVSALVISLVFLSGQSKRRPLVMVLGGLVVVGVAVALVSDGVHYPSDVIASIIWSLGVAPLALGLWNRHVIPRTYRGSAYAATELGGQR